MNEAAESGIKHLNEIRSDLLRKIKERRQEFLDALLARSLVKQEETEEPPAKKIARLSNQLMSAGEQPSNLQLEFAKLSKETSEFGRKWNSYFQRVDLYVSEQEIATALDQAQAVLDQIKQHDMASRLEVTKERWIQFEANNLFFETRDHLGKLASFSENNGKLKRGE